MKNILIFLVIFVSGYFIFNKDSLVDSDGWYHQYKGHTLALEKAKEMQKPLFVFISTSRCGACKLYQREILKKSNIKKYFSDGSIIPVSLKMDRPDRELSDLVLSTYPMKYVPTVYLRRYPNYQIEKLNNPCYRSAKGVFCDSGAIEKIFKSALAQ